MMTHVETRCEARIYERPRFIHAHRCTAKAVGERQGHAACGRHMRTRLAPYWTKPGDDER